jgi:stearoyl-CoA desaturase (Delta-9 desaturase)
VTGDRTALLGGGAAWFLLRHHPTFRINSLCHLFGKQTTTAPTSHATSRGSRIPTWGEAWHNTYHAFPTFSRHRADGREIDLSAQFIELMEKLGIAYDVVRVGPARRARKP